MLPLSGASKKTEQGQQGGFATAARSNNGDHLAVGGVERDVLHRVDVTRAGVERLVEILYFQHYSLLNTSAGRIRTMVAVATLEPSAAITMAKMKANTSVDHPTDVCRAVNVLWNPPKCSAADRKPPDGGVKPLPPPVKPPAPPPRTNPPPVNPLDVDELPPEALTSADVMGLLSAMPTRNPTTDPRMVKVVDSAMN